MLLLYLYILHFCCYVYSSKSNVLLLIVDDLRPNLGIYGYKNAYTPHIDELASKSFVFKRAFVQQALCAPSRNSLLTSRRPDSLHLYDFYSYWRESVGNFTTLSQHFKDNGYYTYSIGKVFHPGISSNFSDDFPYSWSRKPFHPKTEVYKNGKVCPNVDGTPARNLLCPVDVDTQPRGTLPDLESLRAALDFFEYQKNITHNQPYFLAVGFHKPHIPFKFPVEYLNNHPLEHVNLPVNRWRPTSMPTVAWNPWTDLRIRDDIQKLNISFPFGPIEDIWVKKIIQHYDAAVTYIDDLIGQLVKKVDENTIIILLGDNGWSLGEHGEFSKYSTFDVATNVPLIIHVPKFKNVAESIENPVELVDLFPTLVDLTQVSRSLPRCPKSKKKTKLCTEGKSLLPMMVDAIINNVDEQSVAFSQYPRPGPFPTEFPNSDKPKLHQIEIMGYSLRTNRYRYSEWVGFNHSTFQANWTNLYGRELYDHFIDPKENLNLAYRKEMNYTVKQLRKKLILGWRYT